MYSTASGKKMVMDYQFFDRPVTFTEWKNNLVFTKRECVTEFNFLDYDAGADQTQDCYTKFGRCITTFLGILPPMKMVSQKQDGVPQK